MDISVLVPFYNEEESLPELFAWIKKVMEAHHYSYEIIALNDGSTDKSWEVVKHFSTTDANIKGISFLRNHGKSAALYEGFSAAKGDVVITMDADLQDSPDEIPALYAMIKNQKYDLVSGWKKKRYDNTLTKNLPSKLYNYTNRKISGIALNDMNCGLKAYKNEVVKSIEVYGEMHRFIPVLAKNAGYSNIGEKVVQHQSRKYGVSKFGWDRFINGFLDLLTITFLSRFGKRPMHFFGTMGIFSFFIGFIILLYLSITKALMNVTGMTQRPLFYFGILAIIVGMQLFVGGFVGELISRNSVERNNYPIGDKIRL